MLNSSILLTPIIIALSLEVIRWWFGEAVGEERYSRIRSFIVDCC